MVGSLSSLVFLFSLCFATMVEALQTLFHTDHLDTMHHPEWVLILAGADIAVWLVALTAFGGYSALQVTGYRLYCTIGCSCKLFYINSKVAFIC